MKSEQHILRASMIAGLAMSVLGIVFGLVSGSYAITFDGVFSLVDVVMTVVSMFVVALITRYTSAQLSTRTQARFQRGFWHLEPMVLAANAFMVIAVTVYAIVNAIGSLAQGGREVDFGPGMIYAVVIVVLSVVMAALEHRANKKIGSDFVSMDVAGWVMGGGITAALLVAFGIGFALNGTDHAWLTSYIDPAVLVVIGVALLPVPAQTLVRAVADILLVAPLDLRTRAHSAADQISADEGFLGHRTYVSRVGRGTQIEVNFIVDDNDPPRALSAWDAVRERVLDLLGGPDPHLWLTISFTTDPRWAE